MIVDFITDDSGNPTVFSSEIQNSTFSFRGLVPPKTTDTIAAFKAHYVEIVEKGPSENISFNDL